MKEKRYARVINGGSSGFMNGAIVEIVNVEKYTFDEKDSYNYEVLSSTGATWWVVGEHLEEVEVIPK